MSMAADKTVQLWQAFMPRRKEIMNRINADFISLQIFPERFEPTTFNGQTQFTKWAAVAVDKIESIPPEMEVLTIPNGLYAVFLHKGKASNFLTTFNFIYAEWLPQSGYELVHRPHFEILGEKYKNNDDESEEEIWIPVQPINP